MEASINKSCTVEPGKISIEKGYEARDFKMIQIESGNNCYNGSKIIEDAFMIKNSAGKLVYSSKSDEDLSHLKLKSGIYHLYVDGGRGAYIKIKYVLKSIDP